MNLTRRRQGQALRAAPAFFVVAGLSLLLTGCGVGLFATDAPQSPALTLTPGSSTADPAASAVNGSTDSNSAAPVLVVIGDSISTGYQTSAEDSWPNLLMLDFNRSGAPMTVVNAADNGAGYLVPGDEGTTFEQQAKSSVPANANVVLVYGSENDLGADVAQISSQVELVNATVREQAPEAQIVFIGPASYERDVDPELSVIRDQIAAGAAAAGAEFIDPIDEQWIMGDRDTLIGPDGDHPSVQGHVYLAQKFEAIVAPLMGIPTPSP